MFKEILKNNKKWTIINCLFSIVSSSTMVYAGYSLSFLFGATQYTSNAPNKLFIDAIKVTGIWLIALLILFIKQIVNAHTTRLMRNDLRIKISNKITNLDYQEFHDKDSGNYVSWLTNDVQQISEQAFSNFFSIIDNIATTLFAFLAMLKLSLYIGLISILLFFITTFLPQYLSKIMIKITKEKSEGQELFVEKIKETIMGYNIFKVYNTFSVFSNRIKKSSNDIEDTLFKYTKMESIVSTLIIGISLISQVILLILTIFLSISNITPIGAVLAVGNLAGSFFSGIGATIQSISILKSSKPLFEKYSLKNDDISLRNIENIDNITFKDISYSYSDKKILENINISFNKGNKYVITGESGSGKSTLLKILIGFLKDYNGNVLYNNVELKEISPNSIYNNISYIEQNVYIFNGTIKENIILGQDFSDDDLYDALNKSCLLNFINELPDGVNSIIKENGKNISGGQKQRIALARAVIRKIKFIILDEGTSALDKENAKEIEDTLISSEDLCVIFVTHNLRSEISSKVITYSI